MDACSLQQALVSARFQIEKAPRAKLIEFEQRGSSVATPLEPSADSRTNADTIFSDYVVGTESGLDFLCSVHRRSGCIGH